MVLSTVLALASTYSSLLRIDSPMPRDPQVAESLWRELDAQPRAFDELAFFSQSVHSIRSLDYHRELAAKIAVQLAEARRRGYRAGINVLCTVGFMEDAADPALDSMPYRVVEGKRMRGSLCPTDPKTLAFIDAQYRIYAAVHPDFIYVDDDIDSCWCECARCQSVRKSQGQWKIKEGLFDAVARAVRAVDPAIELGGMFWADAALDGGTWSRTLAGGKRGERLTRWRPGGGNWNDLDVFGLVGKLEKCASVQCRGLDPSVRRIQAEIENYPDLQLMKSPDYMGFEALAQLGWGANGIAWNFLNLLAAPASDYREFISKCAAVRPAAEKIVASLGDSAARGVSFRWKLPRKDSVPTAYELAMVGVPTASDPEHAVVTLLSAADVAKLDDGEIRTVLSGGVLMETAALSALNARGFGEWTGFRAGGLTDRDAVTRDLDHPLNVPGRYVRDLRTSMGDRGGRGASCGPFPLLEQTDPKASFTREAVDLEATRSYGPAAGVFENGLGGRIAVEPLAPFGTATQSVRAADVKKLLRWLSRDRLPGYVASFHRVAARFRSRGTFVMNVSSTSAKGVELALLGGRQLSCTSFMGGVETGSCALTPLRHDGPYAIYALPDMAPLGQLLLTSEPTEPLVIDAWEDALPLGNGQAGALVWGGGKVLRITLDRADYWHLSTNAMFRNPAFTWRGLIEYAARPLEERRRLFEGREGDSTKLPGVRLELKFANAQIRDFNLDMCKAEAVVSLDCGGIRKPLRAWFVDGDPLLHVALPSGVEINSAEFVRNPAIDRLGGYPDPVVTRTAGEIVYRRGHRERSEWAKEFIAGIRLVDPDSPSDTVWWNRFRAESSVSVPDATIQRLYDFAMYLYGSGSRDGFAPIALQGLWTADNGDLPPWHGDYHHDLNSQMTYWASPVAGHFNSHDAFASHLTKLVPAFRGYARRFFEIDRGLVVPGAMGYDGSFIAGWSQYAIPPSSGLWMYSILYDGWLYRPTRKRLEAIYPFGVELAEAADRLLLPPDADGVRRWPVSTSPEVGDNGNSAWYRPNSNYDRSILVGFFRQMTHLAIEMGDASAAGKYRELSRSFGPPALSQDGRYLLADGVDLNESHRHISHLLDVFPFCQVADGADARRSLDHFERQGTTAWIGFTPVWAAVMESRLGAGDRALGYLKVFADAFVSRSGFHLNGDQTRSGYTQFTYRPFTLEANFCFARVVQEMLIGAYADCIRIFPAVPVAWRLHEVSFRDLRIPGGHRVSAVLRPDGSVSGSVTGFSDARLNVALPDGTVRRLDVRAGKTVGI